MKYVLEAPCTFSLDCSANWHVQLDSMPKCLLLDSQQEVIRRRLSLQLPSTAPMTASSPEFQSISATSRPSYASPWSPEPEYTSTQSTLSHPIPTMPGTAHRRNMSESHTEDSDKLCDINKQIKATLTDLLNTESVRSDEKYRVWVQARLLDAEHQIRLQRRRRSSADKDMAELIAQSL